MSNLKNTVVAYHMLVRCRTTDATGALYCGRGIYGKVGAVGEYGWLGSPIKIGDMSVTYGVPYGEDCPICRHIHVTAAETLPCYEMYLRRRLATDTEFAATFDEELAANGRLACFCPDDDCHTAVMAMVWAARNGVTP